MMYNFVNIYENFNDYTELFITHIVEIRILLFSYCFSQKNSSLISFGNTENVICSRYLDEVEVCMENICDLSLSYTSNQWGYLSALIIIEIKLNVIHKLFVFISVIDYFVLVVITFVFHSLIIMFACFMIHNAFQNSRKSLKAINHTASQTLSNDWFLTYRYWQEYI